MAPRILITGASGTIGTEVCRQLLDAGAYIRIAYNSERGKIKLEGFKAEKVKLDFNEMDSISTALQGANKVFFLTPVSPEADKLAEAFCHIAGENNIEHIVRLSAMGAGSSKPTGLLHWHRNAEKVIELSGINYTFLRPNGFMQNFINFYSNPIKEKNEFYLPCGKGKISYVDVRDIASVAVKALTESGHEKKIYTLTGPEAIDHYQISSFLSEAAGRKIEYVELSDKAARDAILTSGMPEFMADALIDIYTIYRNNGASQVTDTVKAVTGNDPARFRKFAQDYSSSFK